MRQYSRFYRLVARSAPELERQKWLSLLRVLPILGLGEVGKCLLHAKSGCLAYKRDGKLTFGFLVNPSRELFELITAQARAWGCERIIGPVQWRTMCGHRVCVGAGVETDILDRPVEADLATLLREAGYTGFATYTTYHRRETKDLQQHCQPKAERLRRQGYALRPIPQRWSHLASLRQVHALTNLVFANFPGYRPLAFWRFVLYHATVRSQVSLTLQGIYRDTTLVGYYTFYETSRGLHIKTVAVHPDERGRGLLNLVIARTHGRGPVWYDTVYAGGAVAALPRKGLLEGSTYASFARELKPNSSRTCAKDSPNRSSQTT